MIKLNLLPPYVLEKKRIITLIWVSVVFIGLEVGGFFKAYTDFKLQEQWFINDQNYYTQRSAMIAEEKSKAEAIGTKVGPYSGYISFFTRGDTVKYAQDLAKTIAEPASILKSDKDTWYNSLVIDGDKISAEGKIKGLMNFVNYYFALKNENYTLEPKAQPFPTPLNQEYNLVVGGTIKNAKLPTPPTPPESVEWQKLYQEAGAKPAAAEGAAAGAAGAPTGGAGAPPPGVGGMGAPPPPGGAMGAPPPPGGGMGAPGAPPPPPSGNAEPPKGKR